MAERQPEEIALYIGIDSWEYPLSALLNSRLDTLPQITHMSHLSLEQILNSQIPFIFSLEKPLLSEQFEQLVLFEYIDNEYVPVNVYLP